MEGEGDALPEEALTYHPGGFSAEDKAGVQGIATGGTTGRGTQPWTPSPAQGPLSALPQIPGAYGRGEPSLTFEVQCE